MYPFFFVNMGTMFMHFQGLGIISPAILRIRFFQKKNGISNCEDERLPFLIDSSTSSKQRNQNSLGFYDIFVFIRSLQVQED